MRVHPEILEKQKLPRQLVTKRIWEERYEDIPAFERYLARKGYVILKFFLHVSKEEQKQRFLERLDRPEKNWKFSLADAKERGHWDEYMPAYEDMIRATAAPHAPWYVVPADKKWFARLVVAAAVEEALEGLDLAFPKVDEAKKKELAGGPRGARRREQGQAQGQGEVSDEPREQGAGPDRPGAARLRRRAGGGGVRRPAGRRLEGP